MHIAVLYYDAAKACAALLDLPVGVRARTWSSIGVHCGRIQVAAAVCRAFASERPGLYDEPLEKGPSFVYIRIFRS